MVPVFRNTKLWLGLGAFALVQVGAAPDAGGQRTGAAPPTVPPAAMQGGEGGVSAERAAADPAAFLTVLDIIVAHYLAGRGAYGVGKTQAAAELFAHPIAEVYVDMEPVFEARGVAPFRDEMERASELALARAEGDAGAGGRRAAGRGGADARDAGHARAGVSGASATGRGSTGGGGRVAG